MFLLFKISNKKKKTLISLGLCLLIQVPVDVTIETKYRITTFI